MDGLITVNNIIMVISILGMLIWFFFKGAPEFFSKIKGNPHGEYQEPQLAAGFGVLGTFIGIATGLLLFDSSNIEESIPDLLSGMRTAFFTSIVGMAMSLYLKLKQDAAKKQYVEDDVDDEANIATLIGYLKSKEKNDVEYRNLLLEKITSSNELLKNTISDSITQMTKSLVGEGDSTLIGQIKISRTDIIDNQRRIKEEIERGNQQLITEFREFANTMAENNTKVFIEALNETMKDFNNKLQEQFGENFKQLNIAVGRLLDWQENYLHTVEEVTENQKIIFNGINEIKDSMSVMEKSASGITESAGHLTDIIVTANEFENRLTIALENLHNVGEQAIESIPNIQEFIINATNAVNDYANDSIDSIKDTAEETTEIIKNNIEKNNSDYIKNLNQLSKKSIDNINSITEKLNSNTEALDESINEIIEEIGALSDTFVENMENNSTEITETSREYQRNLQIVLEQTVNSIQEASNSLNQDSSRLTEMVSKRIEQMMNDNNKNLQEASNRLGEDLDKKLTESLNSLGIALSQISGKFVEDYSHLAEALKKIISITNSLNNSKYGR